MVVPLLAMSPVLLYWPIALLITLLFVSLFVTATKTRGKRSEQDRRAGLGRMAILCGPLVGASLAWLGNALGAVHPADVQYTYVGFIIIGGIAGFLAGVAFAITGLFSPRDSGGKDLPVKSVD